MGKQERGFGTLEIMLIILLAAAVLAAGFFVVRAKLPKAPAALIPAIATDLSNHFSNASTDSGQWKAEHIVSIPQKVSGHAYAVSAASAPTLSFGLDLLHLPPQSKTIKKYVFFKKEVKPTTSQADLVNEAHAFLKKNGFTSAGTTTTTAKFSLNLADVSEKIQTTTFTRGKDTCLVSQDAQISCFNAEILASLAQKDKPFVDAYLQKHPKSQAGNITFGPLTIKSQQKSGVITASKKAGYDIAEAVIVDNGFRFLGLFYQYQNQWHFVGGANDEFGFKCSDITADPQARTAFYDQVCYDNAQGQIRLDSTRRALQ